MKSVRATGERGARRGGLFHRRQRSVGQGREPHEDEGDSHPTEERRDLRYGIPAHEGVGDASPGARGAEARAQEVDGYPAAGKDERAQDTVPPSTDPVVNPEHESEHEREPEEHCPTGEGGERHRPEVSEFRRDGVQHCEGREGDPRATSSPESQPQKNRQDGRERKATWPVPRAVEAAAEKARATVNHDRFMACPPGQRLQSFDGFPAPRDAGVQDVLTQAQVQSPETLAGLRVRVFGQPRFDVLELLPLREVTLEMLVHVRREGRHLALRCEEELEELFVAHRLGSARLRNPICEFGASLIGDGVHDAVGATDLGLDHSGGETLRVETPQRGVDLAQLSLQKCEVRSWKSRWRS